MTTNTKKSVEKKIKEFLFTFLIGKKQVESRRGANHDDHQAFAFDEGQRRRRRGGGGAQPVEV